MKANSKSYYDTEINLEDALSNAGAVDDFLFLQDLKQRKLFLDTDIDQFSVTEIAKHIMRYNSDDRFFDIKDRRPVLLYIASNGGDVDSGFELIDIIQNSKTPIYTINLGYQYSMGFLIGLAGHKRFALPNAKFLHHDGTNIIINSSAKAKDQMEFSNKVEERIKNYVISRTKVSEEEYEKHTRQEWYLLADEAKEYGMVDYIIGTDCDIDDIV